MMMIIIIIIMIIIMNIALASNLMVELSSSLPVLSIREERE